MRSAPAQAPGGCTMNRGVGSHEAELDRFLDEFTRALAEADVPAIELARPGALSRLRSALRRVLRLPGSPRRADP